MRGWKGRKRSKIDAGMVIRSVSDHACPESRHSIKEDEVHVSFLLPGQDNAWGACYRRFEGILGPLKVIGLLV